MSPRAPSSLGDGEDEAINLIKHKHDIGMLGEVAVVAGSCDHRGRKAIVDRLRVKGCE